MTGQTWGVPRTELFARARTLLDDDRDAVLATVADVEGSAYRRPGAKMIITEEGEGVGHVTAGCLEDEVIELAGEVLTAGEPRVETYDLTEDDDDVWGLGIGCNGVIDILLEPLDEGLYPALDAVASRESIGRVTVLDGDDVGDRLYYRPGEGFRGQAGDLVVESGPRVENLLADGKSGTVDTGDHRLFVDSFVPPPRAVVLGTGKDVMPVVELAKQAEFHVTVVGFRGARATDERFPKADEVVSTSPARLADAVDVDDDTYVVAMTHNFVDDRLALETLVDTPAPYVGLLGPRKRFEEMREAFADEGKRLSTAELDRVYTPAGLDLGSDTPYQIAHSIVGEMLAVANGREPRHLRDREGPIHARIEP